jgi:hypothetical protein
VFVNKKLEPDIPLLENVDQVSPSEEEYQKNDQNNSKWIVISKNVKMKDFFAPDQLRPLESKNDVCARIIGQKTTILIDSSRIRRAIMIKKSSQI